MAYVQRVKRPFWQRNRAEVADDRRPVRRADTQVVAQDNYGLNILSRLIWLAAGIILLLLAFRFILALLGANPSNGFANFIYTTSHPFAAPFFGLFHYNNLNYGVSRFEVYTLVAMLVYLAVAWILSALVNIGRR
ncbi:MAG TPA: hypothetical protein VFW90_00965 [Candidatus Saccharimonadales bacterium]|nr:hypothetical protein [Candidatus Saccharimonadales bacterium]